MNKFRSTSRCGVRWHTIALGSVAIAAIGLLRGQIMAQVSTPTEPTGRTIFVADAHCDNGKRFIGRGEEKLTAFLKLDSAIHAAAGEIQTHRKT